MNKGLINQRFKRKVLLGDLPFEVKDAAELHDKSNGSMSQKPLSTELISDAEEQTENDDGEMGLQSASFELTTWSGEGFLYQGRAGNGPPSCGGT